MDDRLPLDADFSRIRAALGIPEEFSEAALEAATEAALRLPFSPAERARRCDRRDIAFVTIDPEGSMDLDQAFYAARTADGFRVLYAIADVGFFVDRGDPVEAEAWRRGETLYSPDTQTLLYPPALSRGAASLLPSVERPCVLFTLDLDAEGHEHLVAVERALIVSRAKLSYEQVGEHLRRERERAGTGALASSEWSDSLAILEAVGRLRQRLEVLRGGVSLPIAAQHVQRWSAAIAGYRLTFRNPEDVEGWNAEISLMTGMAAAGLMIQRGVGLLRVLDPPRAEKLDALRLTAAALGITWPREWSYAEFVRSLDPTNPVHAAVIYHASGVMGSARYVAFEGEVPESARHAAIASYYAHVTAPLRRLADRYVLDLLVELSACRQPASAAVGVLAELPPVMASADRLARTLEFTIVDHAEARLLSDRVGDLFEALVIRLRRDRATVQITDPPVRAEVPVARFARHNGAPGEEPPRLTGDGSALEGAGFKLSLGQPLELKLESAEPESGRISFVPA